MRAVAVIPGRPQSLHVTDNATFPEAAETEALVRVLEAGMCGTDIDIHLGHYGEVPQGSPFLILGHENLGVVEASPPSSGLKAGDLVVATVRRPCADLCLPCRSGQNDMCLTGNFLERGIRGLHGFMSEHYVEDPRYLVKVPHALRDVAVLIEPMSVVQKGIDHAFKIQERLAWAPGRAVVLGAGAIGILGAAALRLRGLEVIVGSREPIDSPKVALLAEAGIRYRSTVSSPIAEWPRTIGPVDLVFEATGAAAAVFPALSLLGPDGLCVLSSVTGGEQRFPIDVAGWNRDMVLGNRVVFGTVNAGRRHFEAAVRDLQTAEERLPGWMPRLITRRLPFTDALRALTRDAADIKTVLGFA
jgi:glucose 1-dehydrogenase